MMIATKWQDMRTKLFIASKKLQNNSRIINYGWYLTNLLGDDRNQKQGADGILYDYQLMDIYILKVGKQSTDAGKLAQFCQNLCIFRFFGDISCYKTDFR